MTMLTHYKQALAKGYSSDPQQYAAVTVLDAIAEELQIRRGIMALRFKRRRVQGLYLWGSVGIGKTWLMDIFYNHLNFSQKRRMHFHPFMQFVHAQLKLLQGTSNPLQRLAKNLAKEVKVLCLDEFLVHDIADAMLLSGLLDALFKQGITLIVTSNTPPEKLYKSGLQRERFLPAIALLQKNTQVFHLASSYDYRLRHLATQQLYFYPLSHAAEQWVEQRFLDLAGDRMIVTTPLTIAGREIPVRALTADVAWFDFAVLCQVPRNTQDYLELARSFHTLLLSNIPKINAEQDNQITYFIHLVDVCYDANVKLIITAEVPIEEIYSSGRLASAFLRTQSRLQEMRSHAYLSKPHQPP